MHDVIVERLERGISMVGIVLSIRRTLARRRIHHGSPTVKIRAIDQLNEGRSSIPHAVDLICQALYDVYSGPQISDQAIS
jgi:hypothetical protein